MAPIVEERVLFNSIPECQYLFDPIQVSPLKALMDIYIGYPEPGKSVVFDEYQKIDIKTIQLDGGFLVKTLYLSIDPT
jgi:hypothetical protein